MGCHLSVCIGWFPTLMVDTVVLVAMRDDREMKSLVAVVCYSIIFI